MGGNAAEAHPCGFKWVTEALEHRKAKLIVVDPRFTRSAAIADVYAPIRVGTDIAFLGGVINYLLSNDKIHAGVRQGVHERLVPDQGRVRVQRRLFLRLRRATSARTTVKFWGYQIGADGFAMVDETLQNPRCVYPADEDAFFALHAGDGQQDLRHAEG